MMACLRWMSIAMPTVIGLRHLGALVLCFGLLVGCNRSSTSTPRRARRQASAPAVPEHPLRERYIGQWQSEGKTVLIILAQPDGDVVVQGVQVPPWQSVINNVRWDADALRYDQYMYYTGPEDFTAPGNPGGDHPYSGVRNDTTIRLAEDEDQLRVSIMTKHLDKPVTDVLTRAPGGG